PEKFIRDMLDLQRGLALKVFFEIACADGRWSPQERELATELLRHVWGADLDRAALRAAIEHIESHARSLTWESLLRPFAEIPLLRERAAEVEALVLR